MTALFKYSCLMYDYMIKHAKEDEATKELVYEGTLKKAFTSTGASTSYYTPIKAILDSPAEDPCITILDRGSGKNPSRVKLNHPPPEGWADITNKDLTGDREAATLMPRLEARVTRLEELIGEVNIESALRNLEERLQKVERKRVTGNGKIKNKITKATNTN